MNDQQSLNTFWKLISSHRIEIPIIQRDYAQGRTDSRATRIRKSFVKALISHAGNTENLHLDFIYGKINGKNEARRIEKNREAVTTLLKAVHNYSDHLGFGIEYSLSVTGPGAAGGGTTTFVPLDGQQRLTTLFLLHWYIAARISADNNAILSGFTYRTRRSSASFCSSLIRHGESLDFGATLSEEISDSSWFFRNWLKDPTVAGMLRTIDEIHSSLSDKADEDLWELWETLTEKDIITFRFLDLDHFELTDELYVKMNARGKHLSDFENFKAWLQDYAKENKLTSGVPNWHKRLDIEWTDIFWSFREAGIYEIDDEYLSFVKLISLFIYAERVTLESSKPDDFPKDSVEMFRKPDFIPPAVFQDLGILDESGFSKLTGILSSLEKGGWKVLNELLSCLLSGGEPNFANKLFSSANADLTWFDSAFIYAIFRFLTDKDKNLEKYTAAEKKTLLEWLRVCRNLIYNTFVNSPDSFVSAVKSIDRLAKHCFDIYSYLAAPRPQLIFFATVQRDEEILKASLILKDRRWETLFTELEKHPYFYGQIGFILKLSSDAGYDFDVVKENGSKCAALFDAGILNSQDFLFHRAMFTLKNYFLQIGSNLNICSSNTGLRDKEENWRRVLRDNDRFEAFKTIISQLETGKEKAGLRKIIKSYRSDSWKKFFIKSPEPFRCCKKYLIRANENKEKVLLFQTLRLYGSHAELRSYSFYCDHIRNRKADFAPFGNEYYYYNERNESQPCFILDEFIYRQQEYELQVYYSYTKNNYEMYLCPPNGKNVTPAMLNKLNNAGFGITKENNLLCNLSENQLLPNIRSLCTVLAELQR